MPSNAPAGRSEKADLDSVGSVGDTPTEFAGDARRNELAAIPRSLPAKVLSGDGLARHGLSELARQQVRVEVLPTFHKPIEGYTVVSDEANERVLLFDGLRGLGFWAFDFALRRWKELETGRFRPDAVGNPSVVLDAKRRRLIWFGGWPPGQDAPVDDLYTLDMSASHPWQWQYVEHQHPWPMPRNGASLVVDADRDRCILFGGDAGPGKSFNAMNDIWTLDLKTLVWTQQRNKFWKRGPSKRWLQAAVLDPTGNRMIMFGGAGRGQSDNALHLLDLETLTWRQVAATGEPLPMTEGHAMICASELNSLFVYGGLRLAGAGPSSMPCLWRCDLKTLRVSRVNLPIGQQPPGRFCHAACYCRHRRSLFCVGGRWNRSVANYYATEGVFSDAFLIHLD